MNKKSKKIVRCFSLFCVLPLCFLLPSKCVFQASLSEDEADIVLEREQNHDHSVLANPEQQTYEEN